MNGEWKVDVRLDAPMNVFGKISWGRKFMTCTYWWKEAWRHRRGTYLKLDEFQIRCKHRSEATISSFAGIG